MPETEDLAVGFGRPVPLHLSSEESRKQRLGAGAPCNLPLETGLKAAGVLVHLEYASTKRVCVPWHPTAVASLPPLSHAGRAFELRVNLIVLAQSRARQRAHTVEKTCPHQTPPCRSLHRASRWPVNVRRRSA